MAIAGVVILVDEKQSDRILQTLQDMPGITTYGIHKENNIVAVLEGDSEKGLEKLTDRIGEVAGVIGVYPAYVNFEQEDETVS